MKPARLLSLLILAFLSLSACSSEKPAQKEQPAAKAAAPIAWKDRTPKQKRMFMAKVIRPEAEKMLKAFDPEHFTKVTCKTCHGKDPKARDFKMPSPDLPGLNAADDFAGPRAESPDETKFMMEVFAPRIAELMGLEPWSPENPKGFGCFSCHTEE